MSSDSRDPLSPLSRFLSESRILILDGQFSSRVTLRNTLISFGAKPEQIQLAKNLKEAVLQVDQFFPNLVFSEFQLEDGIGTSLLRSDRKSFIFILVSSLSTHSVVANASEMEVDQFVFKPYSQNHLREVLEGVIQQSVQPAEQDQLIEDGKELLLIGEFEKAAMVFELAKRNPSTYTKACAYLGEIQKLKNEYDQAFTQFREGLASTEVHFRCLMGLFNSLVQSSREDEAYRVLKDVLLYFPECPERLIQALEMAIKTQNFVDIEEMYVIFNLMFEKTEDLFRFMACALLVNGSYHLRHDQPEAAIESFVRALQIQKQEKHVQFVKAKLEEYCISDRFSEILENLSDQEVKKAA